MKILNLFGVVYPESDCINANDVSKFLASLEQDEEFTVYINSPGGSVFEGLSIYNLLSAYQSQMTIKIIGEASSIASVIAVAGGPGKTLIAETAMMLIHKPWTFAIVDEDYMQKLAKNLGTIKNSTIKAYARKSGKSENVLNDLMTEGDYHDANDCVGIGIADSVYVPSEQESNQAKEVTDKVKALINKYVLWNLDVEKKIPTFQNSDGDNPMFKTIEEATVEIGKLQNQNASLEAQNKSLNDELQKTKDATALKDTEIKNLSEKVETTQAQNTEHEKKFNELNDKVFLQDAKLFCEEMFHARKLTRAEINGKADLTKGETPDKVAALVRARKSDPQLYDMLCDEIKNRNVENISSLSKDFSFAQNDSEGSLDEAIEKFNAERSKR